jgi:D-glycero-D-manno-heptose 1,7-bisphosphate phosphatase
MTAAQTGPERACVFLDRDGTLNVDHGYVHLPEQLQLLPHVAAGLAALRQAGFLLIVVTNQSGVARGYYDEAQVERFHSCLDQQLGAAAAPDAYFHCPYHPDALQAEYRQASPLRKPDIGMFELARRAFPIAVERSFMVGDKDIDMEFAARAGLRGILLSERAGPDELGHAYIVRPDFAAATQAIIALAQGRRDAWTARAAGLEPTS